MHVPWISDERRSTIGVELDALARGIGGGLLFGMPLLFTMEMWWVGEFTGRPRTIAFLVIAFLINVALSRLGGFRSTRHGSLRTDVEQAIEAMAIGVVLSTVTLFALGRLNGATSPDVMLGTIAMQVVPLSLGVMVADVVFTPSSGRVHDSASGPTGSPLRELLSDVGATFAGAVFIGFAIAPTDEVPMLAVGMEPGNIIATVALALMASYVIVFASGFDPSHRAPHPGGLFQNPFSETMLSYAISLVAAAVMLVGFGQIDSGDPPHAALIKILVLAVPASIGGAGGRVVV
jgi:putative integral membrane protein (TIGR02587 family)